MVSIFFIYNKFINIVIGEPAKALLFFALKTSPYMRTKLYISKGGIKDERNNKH